MSCWCNFVILLLVFEVPICAQLSNFEPFHGPEAIRQRLFASHWNDCCVVQNKTRVMGSFVSGCVMLVQFCNFVLGF